MDVSHYNIKLYNFIKYFSNDIIFLNYKKKKNPLFVRFIKIVLREIKQDCWIGPVMLEKLQNKPSNKTFLFKKSWPMQVSNLRPSRY